MGGCGRPTRISTPYRMLGVEVAAFAANPPAVTMIVVGLLDPRWKLKMEAEAVV